MRSNKRTVARWRRIDVTRKSTRRVGKNAGKKREELTTDQMILKSWEKTYANRHHRLDD